MQELQESLSSGQVRISLKVTPEVINAAMLKKLMQQQHSVRLNGFRPGKVPLSLIVKRFGAAVRQEEAQRLVYEALTVEISNKQMDLLYMPQVESLTDTLEDGVTAVFLCEVFPEIDLGSVSSLQLKHPKVEIDDAALDEMILTLRRQSATWSEVARPAVQGDRISIRYLNQTKADNGDGKEIDWSKAVADQWILTDSLPAMQGMEQLIGMTTGEHRTVRFLFSEYVFETESVQSVEQMFTLRIEKIEEASLPEVDQKFIAQFMDAEENEDQDAERSMESFRSTLINVMRMECDKAISRLTQRSAPLKVAASIADINIPETLFNYKLEQVRAALGKLRGMEALRWSGLSEEQKTQRQTKEAQQLSLMAVVLRATVRKYALAVTPEMVQAEASSLAMMYENPMEAYNSLINNNEVKAKLETGIADRLAQLKLLELMQTEDEPLSYRELFARVGSLIG